MGSGARLASRIYTNSFAGKEREMAYRLVPKLFFGFQNRNQYGYNTYHQLANNGPGIGSRAARWSRANNETIKFIPPY